MTWMKKKGCPHDLGKLHMLNPGDKSWDWHDQPTRSYTHEPIGLPFEKPKPPGLWKFEEIQNYQW